MVGPARDEIVATRPEVELTGVAYLDNQATTPLDPRVLEAMLPALTEQFGNAGSRTHAYGRDAALLVERARERVAELISAEPGEIVFTSGATESNNLALLGVARAQLGRKRKIVTQRTEHKSILDACAQLQREGFQVTLLPVGEDGLVNPASVANAIDDETALVSIMWANNEIGVVQDVEEIGRVCRTRGVPLHTDAVQAAGTEHIDLASTPIDLLSISAHKMYGPKGVGALYVRRRSKLRMAPLVFGGGQERGLRSGTLPVHQIVGLGAAFAVSLGCSPCAAPCATAGLDVV